MHFSARLHWRFLSRIHKQQIQHGNIFTGVPIRKINDLVHTKLDVSFDYDKQWMYGEEWVTLEPHFYPTDSLTLDAKGMDIKEIAMLKGNSKTPLKYAYDSMQLRITLDKTYKEGEKYTLYLKYISRPNEVKLPGSAAITGCKRIVFY